MKSVLTNYRYYVLTALLIIAILGIFSTPADYLDTLTWVYCLVSSKVIGFTAAYFMNRLFTRWERRRTIPELVNGINNF